MNNLEKKVIFCIFSATFLTAGLIIIFSFFLFRSDHRFVELWKQKKILNQMLQQLPLYFIFRRKWRTTKEELAFFLDFQGIRELHFEWTSLFLPLMDPGLLVYILWKCYCYYLQLFVQEVAKKVCVCTSEGSGIRNRSFG